MEVTEERVRALAYWLWQEAGEPKGYEQHFWGLAVEQLHQPWRWPTHTFTVEEGGACTD
jgi:hypothetical protein